MLEDGERGPDVALDGDVLAILKGVPPDLFEAAAAMFRRFCDGHEDADLGAVEIARAIASTVFRPVLEQEHRLDGLHMADGSSEQGRRA